MAQNQKYVDDLIDYHECKTLDDLNQFLNKGDISSCDSLFALDLFGCDWACYIKSMHNNMEKSS